MTRYGGKGTKISIFKLFSELEKIWKYNLGYSKVPISHFLLWDDSKSMFTQNFTFSTCSNLFIPVHFTRRMLMNFEWKSEERKREKNVYTFLLKLPATTKQFIRRSSIYCLTNQAIFSQVSIKTGLTPPLLLFVFICSLKIPLLPFTTKPLLKRVHWKTWKELMTILVHSCF